jgi:hypothetical protein
MKMDSPDHPRIVEFNKRLHQAEREAEKLFDTFLELKDILKGIIEDLGLPSGCTGPLGPMHVAHNLRISLNYNGRYTFTCDLQEFTLSPQLADALLYLSGADAPETHSRGDRNDPDELVAWRTRSDILDHLQKSSKTKLRPAYVNNIADKLNKALAKKTGYALIIRGDQGVRLALKRGGIQDLRKPSQSK